MIMKFLMLAAVVTTGPAAFAQSSDVPKYKIAGDFRYRGKGTTLEGQDEQLVNEIRARLGFQFVVNDVTKAIFRITTGTGGTSSNQKLGANTTKTFEHKAFNLDQAFIGYKPDAAVELMLGKTANPFFAAGKNQLIWDSDISPEGLSIKTNFVVSDGFDVFFNAGSYWVAENHEAGKSQGDTGVVGGQLGLKFSVDTWKFVVGAGQTDYVGFKEDALVETKAVPPKIASDTNSVHPDGSFVYGYKLTELFIEVSTKFDEVEPMLFAQSVTNSEAPEKKSALWAGLGLNYGQLSVVVASVRSEKDAVVAKLTDSDLPGTDISATRYTVGYKLAENTQMALTHQQASSPIENGRKNLWTMVDVMVNF